MKKFITILLVLLLALSLAACGNGQDQSAPSGDTETEAPAAQEDAEDEADTQDNETEAPAELGGSMNAVCTSESYKTLFDKFTEETGVSVDFLSMSSGEVIAKIDAEGGSSSSDLWFGGGIDAFMEAQEKGYLAQMSFDALADLAPQYKDADNYWISKGLTIAGFLVNNDIVEQQGLPIPQTWQDLTDPVYKDEILMSNPAISGTNYAVVNALIQKMGEEDGWAFWEAVNENITYYSRRGSDPRTKAAAGEVAIGIIPMDNVAGELADEQDLTMVYPTDGIPYMPEGVAVFAGSPNEANAHVFVEWLFSNDENLVLLAEIDGKDTVKVVKPGLEGLELTFDTATMIEVDLSLYGSQRTELLEKWNVIMGDKAEEEEE